MVESLNNNEQLINNINHHHQQQHQQHQQQRNNSARHSVQQQRNNLNDFEKLNYELVNNYNLIRDTTNNNGKRIGFYSIGNELGSGNFSQVKLGIHLLTKDRVAVKILDKTKLDEKTQRLLFREITSMEKLHHPNIIRLYEVINTPTRLYICMEYAAEGELYTRINHDGKLSESECKQLYSQIIAAVDHMHSHNIIHRDIKAENVFFSNGKTIKVGDFGFSTYATREQQLNTFCGSPPYAAPELFRDDSYIGVYVDVWALGVLLYFMTTASMPFKADTVGRLKRCIINGEYVIPSYVSDSCQLLIRGILKQVPADRFTIKEIMESAWLDGETFPTQLEPYQLTPTVDKSELKKEEKLARQYLERLGISEEMLIKNQVDTKVDDINTFENSLIFKQPTTPGQTPTLATSTTMASNSTSSQSESNGSSSNNNNNNSNNSINPQEFRNSINGTYRIIYHRIQRQLRTKYQNIEKEFNGTQQLQRLNRKSLTNHHNNDIPLSAAVQQQPINSHYHETKIVVLSNGDGGDNRRSTPDIRENSKRVNSSSGNKQAAAAPNPNNLFVKYNNPSSNNNNNNENINMMKKRLSNAGNSTAATTIPTYRAQYSTPAKIQSATTPSSSRQHSHTSEKQAKTAVCSIL